jgi:hypothetical protein
MQILQLKNYQNFLVTEAEATSIYFAISKKRVIKLSRLGDAVISEYLINCLAPNEDWIGKELFCDKFGIIYFKKEDGSWFFYKNIRKDEKETENEENKVVAKIGFSNVSSVRDANKDLRTRTWEKVNEFHEALVLPADDYLNLKYTPKLNLFASMTVNNLSSAVSVINSPIIAIGREKKIEREQKMKQKWEKTLAIFRKKSAEEKHNFLLNNYIPEEYLSKFTA